MNVTAHQEEKKNEERKKSRRKKSENRQPILKKLCAALLQSFRGQHSKKMKGSAQGNWHPWEGQQPFCPNPSRVRDRTTMLRRLLIAAVLTARWDDFFLLKLSLSFCKGIFLFFLCSCSLYLFGIKWSQICHVFQLCQIPTAKPGGLLK